MSKTVIKIENLSKVYRLGEVGTGTLSHDLNRFWKMNILGQDDPYAKVGQVNDRTAPPRPSPKGRGIIPPLGGKRGANEYISALSNINLEVKEGEVLGIIGKNGAGKSTLLKLLSRVTSPTTGSIKVKGRLASLLEVGTGFHPEMTGRENIYMNGTIMGMRKWEIDRKLDEIVEFAGVAKYLDTPTKRYSSGMTVRLGFAIAAHLEPEILVVDEVLAVGDAEFQKKAIGKMQDVSTNQGRTVLFVSHNMDAVKRLCKTGLVLCNGEESYKGTIDNSIASYLSLGNRAKSKQLTSGNVTINSFIFNNGRNLISNFEETNILIEFTLKESPTEQIDIKAEIFLKNQFNETLSTLSSWLNNTKINIADNKAVLSCQIPNGFPLPNGDYTIDFRLFVNFQQYDFYDIASIEIVNNPKNSFQHFPFKEMHGKFLVKNIWNEYK